MSLVKWVPPCLCGCELLIEAQWAGDVSAGVSYQHPFPYTITALEIAAICAQHTAVLKDPIDETPFLNAKGAQTCGYLRLPLPNPTDAEKLYLYLFRYTAVRRAFQPSCGCSVHIWYDRNDPDSKVVCDHPVHSGKCEHHQLDSLECEVAATEFTALWSAREALMRVPELKDAKGNLLLEVAYDEARKLAVSSVDNIGLPKAEIQALCDAALGKDKVLVKHG